MDIEHVYSPDLDHWIDRAMKCPVFEERWATTAIRTVLFHGTCKNIDRLDPRLSDNLESDFGQCLYLSNSLDDVNINYATINGPDLTNKIEKRKERIEAESEDEDELENAHEIAKARMVDHDGAIWPSFVFLENPVVIGGSNETYIESGLEIDYSDFMDAARKQLLEDYDGEEIFDEHEVEQNARYLAEDAGFDYEVTGGLAAILEAFDELAVDDDIFDLRPDEIRSDLEAYIWDGGKASDIFERLKQSEGLMYAQDYENSELAGDLAGNDLLRRALLKAGYDGIVDFTVDEKFGSQRRSGRQMDGMDPDTVHVLVFRADQVQSAFCESFEPKPENHESPSFSF